LLLVARARLGLGRRFRPYHLALLFESRVRPESDKGSQTAGDSLSPSRCRRIRTRVEKRRLTVTRPPAAPLAATKRSLDERGFRPGLESRVGLPLLS
jgi:hypothetical protein